MTPPLTDEMHDAVLHSEIGQFLDRLVREEVIRNGVIQLEGPGGNIIHRLWDAFHAPKAVEQVMQ